MPDKKENDFEYDVFLSYAKKDEEFAERLAMRMQHEGIRVWCARKEILSGNNLTEKINAALSKSYNIVVILSRHHLSGSKEVALVEAFFKDNTDFQSSERRLIPVLIDETEVIRKSSIFNTMLPLDFRNSEDFVLHFNKLINLLKLPGYDFRIGSDPGSREFQKRYGDYEKKSTINDREKTASFIHKVAELYRVLGFKVTQGFSLDDIRFDLMIEQLYVGFDLRAFIECRNKYIDAKEIQRTIRQKNLKQEIVRKKFPGCAFFIVSSKDFSKEARIILTDNNIRALTYDDLSHTLVPLDKNVEGIIEDFDLWKKKHWDGEDWFIRPDLIRDITNEKFPSVDYLANWLNSRQSNILIILGDLGTGKTTLSRFLAYNMAKNYRDAQQSHPAPLFIPLNTVRKESTFEEIIKNHFSSRGLTNLNMSFFNSMFNQGQIVICFDGFDEMADNVQWEVTQRNFKKLIQAAEGKGRVIITCRTHYFKDREEQVKVFGYDTETELYRELRRQSGVEVVYLENFSEDQIKAYLKKARPETAEEDWEKITEIYDLESLAKCPLLLDMIVSSLDKLNKIGNITAANLYNVYVKRWIEREDEAGRPRILDKESRQKLMWELSWNMWNEGKNAIHHKELVSYVERLADTETWRMALGDQSEAIADDMRIASFISRDKEGYYYFMHRSFMEFFLANKIFDTLSKENIGLARTILNTRRFDQKTIYFITLLDEKNQIWKLLSKILTGEYISNISENSLQILYWNRRIRFILENQERGIRFNMEKEISNIDELKEYMTNFIPHSANLRNAKLQGINLEGIVLPHADLFGADLTTGNLNNASFRGSNFRNVLFCKSRCNRSDFSDGDFRNARFVDSQFDESDFSRADLMDAIEERTCFVGVNWEDTRGMIRRLPHTATEIKETKKIRKSCKPIIQHSHSQDINCVEFSPEGTLLAACGRDGVIFLWSLHDKRLVFAFEGHRDFARSLHFSKDGKTLVSGSEDKTIRLWDICSGNTKNVLKGHTDWVMSVHLSPDGKMLASGSKDKTIRLWDIDSGQYKHKQNHGARVMSVHFSPDGKILASACEDNTIMLWETPSLKPLRTLNGHKGPVREVDFSPDGKILVSGSADCAIHLWDVDSGRIIRTIKGHDGWVRSVKFSPLNRQIIASGSSDNTVRLWDADSGQNIHIFEGHRHWVRSVSFSPDGSTLASGSEDKTIRLWDINSPSAKATIEGHNGWIRSIKFSHDGKMIATGSYDKAVRLWDLMNAENPVRTFLGHKDSVWSVNFSPDKKSLASGSADRTARLWDIHSGKTIHTLTGHKHWVTSVCFSPDGKKMATGSFDKTVRLWDIHSGKTLHIYEGHQGIVWTVTFSPHGDMIASGSSDRTIHLWDKNTYKTIKILNDYKNSVMSLCFSPGNKNLLAGGSTDETIRLWNITDGKTFQLLKGHKGEIWSVTFSSDGKILASASADQTVRIWDVETGKCINELSDHLGPVSSVKFAPNMKYLITTGSAGCLQFWDFEKKDPFLYRYCFGPEAWLDLLPNGDFNVSPEGIKFLCYKDTDAGTLKSYSAEELRPVFFHPEDIKETLKKYIVS